MPQRGNRAATAKDDFIPLASTARARKQTRSTARHSPSPTFPFPRRRKRRQWELRGSEVQHKLVSSPLLPAPGHSSRLTSAGRSCPGRQRAPPTQKTSSVSLPPFSHPPQLTLRTQIHKSPPVPGMAAGALPAPSAPGQQRGPLQASRGGEGRAVLARCPLLQAVPEQRGWEVVGVDLRPGVPAWCQPWCPLKVDNSHISPGG